MLNKYSRTIMKNNKSIDFNNDRQMVSSFNKLPPTQSGASFKHRNAHHESIASTTLNIVPVPVNDDKFLSPSQVAREMLYNCQVFRRKDFNVQTLMAGTGNGGGLSGDAHSSSRSKVEIATSRTGKGNISIRKNLLGIKSVLGHHQQL